MDQSSTNTNEEESPLEEPDRRSRSGATTPQRGPCRDDFRVTSGIPEPSSAYFAAERRSPRLHPQYEENKDEEKGYDSDEGPFLDAVVAEGVQDFDYDDEAIVDGEEEDGDGASNEVPSVVGTFQDISVPNLNNFRMERLRFELKIRGIDTKGLRKVALRDRLKKALAERAVIRIEPQPIEQEQEKHLRGFPKSAHWEILNHIPTPVREPFNPRGLRAPTVPEAEAGTVPLKYNYAETFQRFPFTGKANLPAQKKGGGVRKTATGQIMMSVIDREKGCPNPDFLTKHGLDTSSSPVDWLEPFLPISLWGQWTSHSNRKAFLANAGNPGFSYPDFTRFEVAQLKQFVGLYILHGIAPSPRIEMKLKPQSVDEIQGNDFVHRSFGPNAERRLRFFKKFFSVRDPTTRTPSAKIQPNFKIDPLFEHMNKVNQEAWMPARMLAVDEQTIGFQGRHKDKLKITYKNEGDGFQCDAICDDGFTFAFYYRNHPAPQKYVRMGLSPLHSRVMGLLDTLKDKGHRIGFDNLYMSTKFARAAYNHESSVLVHGVTRKGGRGFPPEIIQEEKKTPKEQMAVRGTVKAAVLKGDSDCPDLVACSVYDTKPVNFLSMCTESIVWVEKKRKVYDKSTNQYVDFRFLRLNINDEYNQEMGDVDISDQLRNTYRCDHWLRKTKWWWSMYFWGIGVELVNAYKMYRTYNLNMGIQEKNLMSHYDFRRAIAVAYVGSGETMMPRSISATARKTKRKLSLRESFSGTDTSAGSRRSARLSAPPKKKAKCARFTDASLSANGNLRCRLHTNLRHLPLPSSIKTPHCQLHRWASETNQGISRRSVLLCEDCNVHLCSQCYGLFHKEEDLVSKKAEIREKYSGEKQDVDSTDEHDEHTDIPCVQV